jgi:hypothetical protein
MKHSNGFIFEGDLKVLEYANFTLEPSIAFFGALLNPKYRAVSIVKKADLVVWEVSAKFHQVFNMDMNKVKNYEYHIYDCMPDFRERLPMITETLQENHAYFFNMVHKAGDLEFRLKASVNTLGYLPDYYQVLIDHNTDEVVDASAETINEKGNHFKQATSNIVNPFESQVSATTKKNEKQRSVVIGSKEDMHSDSSRDERSSDQSDSSKSDSDDDGASKSSSVSSKSANLLRMGLVRTHSHMESTLKRLLIFICILLFILCGLSIAVQVLSSILTISRYQATLDILATPVRYGVSGGSYSAMLLDHLLRGTLYTREEDALLEEERIRREMKLLRNQLDGLKTTLYDYGKALTKDEYDLLENSRTPAISYDGTEANVTLIELIHMYSVATTTILNRNMSVLSEDRRPIDFLIKNNNDHAVVLWDNICQTILSTQADNNARVEMLDLIFVVTAVVLVFVVTLFVFIPTVYVIIRQRVEVFGLFEKIEQGNLRDVYSQCLTKLGDLDASDYSANNMDLTDMMEVFASKRLAADDKATGVRKSKLRINVNRILTNYATGLLMVIMLFTIAYFVGYHLWWIQLSGSFFDGIDKRLYLAKSREYYVREISKGAVKWNDTNAIFDMDLERMFHFEQLLKEADHALYYGNKELGIRTDIRMFEGGDEILRQSLCQWFTDKKIKIYSNTSCESYMDGVMVQGAHEVVVGYIGLSQDLRKSYLNDSTNVLPKVLALKELADIWLPSANSIFNDWIRGAFMDGFRTASSTREVGTVLFVLFSFTLLFVVYIPMIRRMNDDLQKTRNLLTIIPADVVESSRALKEQIRVIALRMIQSS